MTDYWLGEEKLQGRADIYSQPPEGQEVLQFNNPRVLGIESEAL